jgi:hypothetical protein
MTNIKTNFQNWLEYDYNPFLLFGAKAEILTLNQSAQFLISKVDQKTIYELALSYASLDFGYKTTIIDLKFDVFNFFAITVGYENEDEIGIKLYQTPYSAPKKIISLKDYDETNIYHLIDTAIVTVASRLGAEFKKEMDPTLPDFKISQNEFVKILTRAYESFEGSEMIFTSMMLKTGEFLRVGDKKFPIIQLKIIGGKRTPNKDPRIEELCANINIFAHFNEKECVLQIPLAL